MGIFEKEKMAKAAEPLKLFEMVQHILSLKIGDYMHHVSIEALKDAESFRDKDEAMMELLK